MSQIPSFGPASRSVSVVAGVWSVATAACHADAFQTAMEVRFLPGLGRHTPGYRGGTVLRSHVGRETQFLVILAFISLDHARGFTCADPSPWPRYAIRLVTRSEVTFHTGAAVEMVLRSGAGSPGRRWIWRAVRLATPDR